MKLELEGIENRDKLDNLAITHFLKLLRWCRHRQNLKHRGTYLVYKLKLYKYTIESDPYLITNTPT